MSTKVTWEVYNQDKGVTERYIGNVIGTVVKPYYGEDKSYLVVACDDGKVREVFFEHVDVVPDKKNVVDRRK